jgi:hypothetical protein
MIREHLFLLFPRASFSCSLITIFPNRIMVEESVIAHSDICSAYLPENSTKRPSYMGRHYLSGFTIFLGINQPLSLWRTDENLSLSAY